MAARSVNSVSKQEGATHRAEKWQEYITPKEYTPSDQNHLKMLASIHILCVCVCAFSQFSKLLATNSDSSKNIV
jgi:hypothetical protein